MDTVMIVLFVLFMIWLLLGYHASKYEERFGENGTERKKEEDSKES
jgi:hypothetical protein